MNWTRIEAQWHQLAAQVKAKWSKLSDEDIKGVAGRRELLIGKIHEAYGMPRADVEQQIDGWVPKLALGGGDCSNGSGKHFVAVTPPDTSN
jgi:uncharacterized protein YjbJ (UPF0337 family)